MMRLCLILTVASTLLAPFAVAAESADDGWKSLFDGKSFGDWKPNERPENWKIEDGAIVGRGERSHLYYMADQFKDFEFQTDVMINEGDYTEPTGADGPRKLGKGYFALQQHDPGSSVRFRNIKVKALP